MQDLNDEIRLKSEVSIRIVYILKYINHPITLVLENNLKIFSLSELKQILWYLETGDLNFIHQFLDDKKKEYLDLINTIKLKKRFSTLSDLKISERLETDKQKQELDLIDFNY